MGRGSAVGIATRYGLEGPEIESQCWRHFLHLSRLALGPSQHPYTVGTVRVAGAWS